MTRDDTASYSLGGADSRSLGGVATRAPEGAAHAQSLSVTVDLPPIRYQIPKSIEEVLGRKGSALGLSVVSEYLVCPEAARLRGMGVRKKVREIDLDVVVDLSENALAFGAMMHALRAVRIVHSMDAAIECLLSFRIDEASKRKAFNILRVYDNLFPKQAEPFEYLGVEVEVVSDIGDGRGGSLLRSVRYDSVVRAKDDGAIFSLECKTSSRSGKNALSAHTLQKFSHPALWNSNPHLVSRYGQMRGTIYDLIVKTEVPSVDRIGPHYASSLHQKLAIDYLRLPERIRFPVNEDGSYPRLLHACYGRFRPCDYVGLCHEAAYGDYEVAEG